jgi:hypothetical protein
VFQTLKSSSLRPLANLSADPQKEKADIVIQVLPTQLIPDDNEGKVLRVRMIQKEGVEGFEPVYLYDEGSTISWIPCGRKLTCSYPGIKFFYGPDTYYGNEVRAWQVSSSRTFQGFSALHKGFLSSRLVRVCMLLAGIEVHQRKATFLVPSTACNVKLAPLVEVLLQARCLALKPPGRCGREAVNKSW